MNIPGFSTAPQAAFTLAYSLAAALASVVVLLFAKGGDSSFFAGVIIAIAGLACAAASLGLSLYSLRAALNPTQRERVKLIVCAALDGVYILLSLLSLGFALLLFSALRN